jgi:hypothetical protein
VIKKGETVDTDCSPARVVRFCTVRFVIILKLLLEESTEDVCNVGRCVDGESCGEKFLEGQNIKRIRKSGHSAAE